MLWVAENNARFDDIVLDVNIDSLGMRDAENHISFYACPAELKVAICSVASRYAHTSEGLQWYQSGQTIYVMNWCPAIALASSATAEFMADYAHSRCDTMALADTQLMVDAAWFPYDMISTAAQTKAQRSWCSLLTCRHVVPLNTT